MQEDDMGQVLDLADRKRAQYAEYQPVFHRPAPSARALQERFFASLLDKETDILLVDAAEGTIDGFLWARLVVAPPVYDPGGLVCAVDDFVVREPALWPTSGRALLDAARLIAGERGAVLTNVVCGPHDTLKRTMLLAAGLSVASEWLVGPV